MVHLDLSGIGGGGRRHGHRLRVLTLLFGSAGMFFKIFFDTEKKIYPTPPANKP